jgi:hypothetical protein
MWMVLPGLALAQDDPATVLADQLLEASVGGVSPQYIGMLTELSRRVSVGDRSGPDTWYWLAHGEAELGRLDQARATLLDGIRTGNCPACRDLFQDLEISRMAAPRDSTWRFGDAHHGVFLTGVGGSMRVGALDERTLLEWTTERGPDSDGRLVFGLTQGMSALVLDVGADASSALMVYLVDRAGHRFVTREPLELEAGRFASFTLSIADFAPSDGRWALVGGDVRRVELAMWAGAGTTAGGAPTYWLDELTIR